MSASLPIRLTFKVRGAVGFSATTKVDFYATCFSVNCLSSLPVEHFTEDDNTDASAVVDAGGTYALLVTNTMTGCSSSTMVVVSEDTAIPVTQIAVPDSLTCNVPSDTLEVINVNAGWTYAWQTTDGVVLSAGNTPFPIVGSDGTYALTVTDQVNGCTFTSATVFPN